jgi:glycosyltransferase involved in cell wall biosynthesis
MRALLVDAAYEWRGGQSQLLLTARGLCERGHAVALACPPDGLLAQRARAAGFAVHPARFGGDLDPRAIAAVVRAIRNAKPDVLQLNDPHAVACGLAAARLTGLVHTVAMRRVDFHLRGALSRVKYRAAHRVIAVSRAIFDILKDDGLDPGCLRLVYEGVPDRAPIPGGEDALRALGVPDGAPVVGNVAALTDHKDHPTLLAAAARVLEAMPQARFVIVGDGERRRALEAQARTLGIDGRCIFTGFRDDVDRLLPAFTVFCLSSHQEGLGTSLLDAMAFCRPVVATAAGGIPEAVEDGVTGRVVPPRDPVALAEALHALLADAPLRAAMGRAGRRRFEEHFTASRMVDETLGVFGEA